MTARGTSGGMEITSTDLLAQLHRKRCELMERAVNDVEPGSPEERVLCREIGMIDAKMLRVRHSANKVLINTEDNPSISASERADNADDQEPGDLCHEE